MRDDAPIDRAQAESLAGSIVVRVRQPGKPELLVGIDGSRQESLDARAIAFEAARKLGS